MLFLLASSAAGLAQCADPGTAKVPEGFNVLSGDLMKGKDLTVIYYVMGVVNGSLQSVLLGAEESCIAQVLSCAVPAPAENAICVRYCRRSQLKRGLAVAPAAPLSPTRSALSSATAIAVGRSKVA